jgi:hypothetical protein
MLRFISVLSFVARFVSRFGRPAARRVTLRGPALRIVLTMSALSALGVTACDSLTSIDAPDVIEADDFSTTAGATALAVAAVTQFYDAFGGGFAAGTQVGLSGAMADELFLTGTFPESDEGAWDNRNLRDPARAGQPYGGLQEARQRLLTAIRSFQRAAPDSSARIGQLFALLGYTSVFFGENFCAGVPLSHRDADLRPVYGQPLATAQLFDSALTAFDSALFYGADSARIVNLARVGQARALLNQGQFAAAAAAVANVPTEYVYNVVYLAMDFFNNAFFNSTFGPDQSFSVPEREGTVGLNWRSAGDPRVVLDTTTEPVGSDLQVVFVPYQAMDAPITLAAGLEARLIEAEAALQSGDPVTWLTIHNTLRATVPGLSPLVDPGTAAGRVDLHFRERAFWLFLTGHRHGDLRRLVRQYGRGSETVFPTGEWRDGIPYGSATNMALPSSEGPNPHYVGCLNRDA